MNCSCIVNSDGEEDHRYYSERVVTAKKDHICVECGNTIERKDKFVFSSLIEPGVSILNFKTCLSCKSIQDNFFQDGWYIGGMFDQLHSYIYESWNDDLPSDCISKLNSAAKDIVCDILQVYQD